MLEGLLGERSMRSLFFKLRDLEMLLMCESLGVSLKEEKSTMANTQLVFLGIEIDTQAMEMPLPLEKLDKIKRSLDSMKYKRKIRLESCSL